MISLRVLCGSETISSYHKFKLSKTWFSLRHNPQVSVPPARPDKHLSTSHLITKDNLIFLPRWRLQHTETGRCYRQIDTLVIFEQNVRQHHDLNLLACRSIRHYAELLQRDNHDHYHSTGWYRVTVGS